MSVLSLSLRDKDRLRDWESLTKIYFNRNKFRLKLCLAYIYICMWDSCIVFYRWENIEDLFGLTSSIWRRQEHPTNVDHLQNLSRGSVILFLWFVWEVSWIISNFLDATASLDWGFREEVKASHYKAMENLLEELTI